MSPLSRLVRVLVLLPLLVLSTGAEDEAAGSSERNDPPRPAADATDAAAEKAKDGKKAKKGKEDPWTTLPSPISAVGGSPEADKALGERVTTLASLRAYCAGRGLAIAEHPGRAVRLLLIGGVQADAKQIVEHADLALKGLETWTGEPKMFMREDMPADEIYTLAIFPDAGARDGFIDTAFAGGDIGLAKKCGSLSFARGNFTDTRILPIVRWWAVFSATRASIDAFYAERGRKPQVWLREGLACELQRLVCDKQVRMYSISYQENVNVTLDGDWPKDVAKLLQGRSQMMLTASNVMLADTIGLPTEHYKQMWSLATFLKGVGKNQRGPENKLLRVFCDTAKGTPARDAVKAAYEQEDPGLTKAWHGWAAQAR
ncbi:MAG TPA: hypothetical protein VEL07_13155 [Planctomycetota bacterium]|nr:hypothetical protein [Planctomycetota bacterium]